jgi:hypothetical protein
MLIYLHTKFHDLHKQHRQQLQLIYCDYSSQLFQNFSLYINDTILIVFLFL